MNFEALIADLVKQIDAELKPGIQSGNKHGLARSLALSEVSPLPIGRLDVDDPCLSFLENPAPEIAVGRPSGPLKQNLRLDVEYKDLSVSLRTEQSIEIQVCALMAQITTLAEHLAHANDKLDQSNRKIGFLEAQVLIQDEQIRQLQLERSDRAKKKRSAKVRPQL
jgi:hypothetical protein